MHGDDEPYGSVQRVELFDKVPGKATLANMVGTMNRAATEDVRSPAWPSISKVLASGKAPNARAAQVKTILDGWVARDAPRLDATDDGTYDEPGPAIMDAAWMPMAKAVMRPRFGKLLGELDEVRSLGSLSGVSYVDKDLRTLLKQKVRGKFSQSYCGKGKLSTCRSSLWKALDGASAALAKRYGPDPAKWLMKGERTTFVPGLIKNSFRRTNRPTFQQALEFDRR